LASNLLQDKPGWFSGKSCAVTISYVEVNSTTKFALECNEVSIHCPSLSINFSHFNLLLLGKDDSLKNGIQVLKDFSWEKLEFIYKVNFNLLHNLASNLLQDKPGWFSGKSCAVTISYVEVNSTTKFAL
jgi:hypothetical protein